MSDQCLTLRNSEVDQITLFSQCSDTEQMGKEGRKGGR